MNTLTHRHLPPTSKNPWETVMQLAPLKDFKLSAADQKTVAALDQEFDRRNERIRSYTCTDAAAAEEQEKLRKQFVDGEVDHVPPLADIKQRLSEGCSVLENDRRKWFRKEALPQLEPIVAKVLAAIDKAVASGIEAEKKLYRDWGIERPGPEDGPSFEGSLQRYAEVARHRWEVTLNPPQKAYQSVPRPSSLLFGVEGGGS